MDDVDDTFGTNYTVAGTNTMVIEGGLSWVNNVGDLRGSMPIGLYIPSHPQVRVQFAHVRAGFLVEL